MPRYYHANVQDISGQLLAESIGQAFQNFRQAKERKAAEKVAAEQREMQMLPLAMQGIRQGTAPMEAAVPTPRMDGGKIVGVEAAPERYTQLTPGFYQDTQVTTTRAREERERAMADTLAKEMAKVQAQQAADPEGFALGRRRELAEIRALETPKPQPVQRWQPTTREEALAFEEARARIAAQYRPPRAEDAQGPGKPPSEGERRAAALYKVAQDAYGVLSQASAPSRVEAGLARLGMNEGLSQQRQAVEQSARQFVTSYLYVVSGATASPQEVDNLTAQIVPQPGDKADTIQRKREAMDSMMQAMATMGGRAASPSPAAPTPAQLQRAQADPQYRQFLLSKGYRL